VCGCVCVFVWVCGCVCECVGVGVGVGVGGWVCGWVCVCVGVCVCVSVWVWVWVCVCVCVSYRMFECYSGGRGHTTNFITDLMKTRKFEDFVSSFNISYQTYLQLWNKTPHLNEPS
jgi:hypothetical protein